MNKADCEGGTVDIAEGVVSAIHQAIGNRTSALHEPHFGGNEWLYVKECLDSTFVSYVGKFVDRFERDLAETTGAASAVAVTSGTAALHVALLLAGVARGDEVLVPALTFVATTNAVAYCGARPHFVDSEESSLGIGSAALREYLDDIAEVRGGRCINKKTGRVISALVPVHIFGHPVDIEGLLAIARDFRLPLIEDAAESLGSTVCEKQTGTFGMMGVLSFNGNKTITTGGGGAILTNDISLASRAKHLTTTARLPHKWGFVHDEVGYNYRLPNINAALGCAQLEQLPNLLAAKRVLFSRYKSAFTDMHNMSILAEPDGCRSNYWLQTLILDKEVCGARDAILEIANEGGLMVRPTWTLMHRLKPFAGCQRMDLPVAESLEQRVINLPSSAQLAMDADV